MTNCEEIQVNILDQKEEAINVDIPSPDMVSGSRVYFNNEFQPEVHFDKDPQQQINDILIKVGKAAVKLEIEKDTTNYIYKFLLKDANGNILSQPLIDLPMESAFVDGRYDAETKSIILVMQSGKEIVIPIGDLIGDLVTKAEFEARTQKVYLGSIRSGQEFPVDAENIAKIFSEYPPLIIVKIANWKTYLKIFDESGDERYFSNNMFYDENETKYLISMVINKVTGIARVTKVEEPRMPKPEAQDNGKTVIVKNGKYTLEKIADQKGTDVIVDGEKVDTFNADTKTDKLLFDAIIKDINKQLLLMEENKLEVRLLPILGTHISQAEAREIIEAYKDYEGAEIHFYTNGENPANFVEKGYVMTDTEFNPHLIIVDGKGKRYEYDAQGFRIISTTREELVIVDTKATRAMQTAQQKLDKTSVKNAHDNSQENVYSTEQTNNEIIDSFKYNFRQLFNTNIYEASFNRANVEYINNEDGSFSIKAVNANWTGFYASNVNINLISNHKYYFSPNIKNGINLRSSIEVDGNSLHFENIFTGRRISHIGVSFVKNGVFVKDASGTCSPILIDLTEMFGAGNEPSTVEEVQQYLVKDKYYPYGKNIEPSMYVVRPDVMNNFVAIPSNTREERVFPDPSTWDSYRHFWTSIGNGYLTIQLKSTTPQHIRMSNSGFNGGITQTGVSIYSNNSYELMTLYCKKGDRVVLITEDQTKIDYFENKFIYDKEI